MIRAAMLLVFAGGLMCGWTLSWLDRRISPNQRRRCIRPAYRLAVLSARREELEWVSSLHAKIGGLAFDGEIERRLKEIDVPPRKAASAQIARIPLDLARWVARLYKP